MEEYMYKLSISELDDASSMLCVRLQGLLHKKKSPWPILHYIQVFSIIIGISQLSRSLARTLNMDNLQLILLYCKKLRI